MRKITKAVFPVAGLGTRFLPATKASPKEMLNVVDKPLIQYAVEEAIAAGINELIFVTGRNKRSIEDHFDKAYELEAELEAKGKTALLEVVRGVLPRHVNCAYIRQPDALGLGHAVLCARPLIGDDEHFAVILADDLIDATPVVMQQMLDVYTQTGASVIGVQEVPRADTASYGIVSTQPSATSTINTSNTASGYLQLTGIVEKPQPAEAPSTLAALGRYIFSPRIFHYLSQTSPGKGGEIQLTDAIAMLLKEQPVFAWPCKGTRYDCGSKLGYLQATLVYASRHHEVGEPFKAHLQQWLEQKGADAKSSLSG